MNKTIIALAVASLTVAATSFTAANAAAVYDQDGTSLDVYGRVQSV